MHVCVHVCVRVCVHVCVCACVCAHCLTVVGQAADEVYRNLGVTRTAGYTWSTHTPNKQPAAAAAAAAGNEPEPQPGT
jgi:hypothetical protein